MKDICVENFNYSNAKEWVSGYTHKQKVEFAVYYAELVIDLYTGTSNAPKKAIQAAKDWILNPSKDNKKKCKAAANAAYADAANAADDAAAAAAYAANAAYADAAAAAADAANAAYAAAYAYAAYVDTAYAADAAAYADAAKKSIKEKIVSYILGESKVEAPEEKEALDAIEQPNRTKVVYEKVTTVFSLDRNKMNDGAYGVLGDDGNFYPTYDEVSTVRALIKDSLHIKSEKPIDWWEESVDYVVAIKGDAKGVLYSNGILSIDASMTRDQWCDFARILLEQES